MQIFTCPFCGPRNEREFHFAGEAGKVRPDTTQPVSDADWGAYLFSRRNDKGAASEVWMHLTCREMFILRRDTVTMTVLETRALRKDAP
ncbi:sarcosine oxidase subunit delta [uncultured Sulfitobacter sp.]|uniref:sarcosine oxidase subunit delta n=1 Tax=uncultured Sulfitobacter sp. TaxID=191468 RepID=UPI002616EEB9|nr:sarcosine oxidase subunit delta [uncultured Sulfitobacter sp.]